MNAPERGLGRGPRSLIGSVLAAAAVCGSLLALDTLIEPGDWLPSACVAVVLLAALTAVVRAAGRAAWLPSLVGAVAGLAGLVVQYGGPRAGTPTLPTPEALRRAWALAGEGVRLIQDSMVPMPPERSGELVVVAAAIAVFLLVDALALGADVPALSALPLVAFWLPAVFLAFPTNGWALFWTGLAYLLLLALSAAPSVGDSARVRQVSTIVAGAVGALVLAIVAGPVLSALPAWAAVSLPDLGRGPVGPVQLSEELDLRDSLGQRSGQTVLTYTVSPVLQPGQTAPAQEADPGLAPAPSPSSSASAVTPNSRAVGPLRAFSVSDFDGRTWQRAEGGTRETWGLETVLGLGSAGGRVFDAGDPQAVRVEVRIEGLEQADLPISTFPRTLEVRGPWAYDPVRDEIVGRRPTSAGLEYTMNVIVPSLTAEDLRTAQPGSPPGPDDFLALPDSEHLADVRTVAAEVTADATTPYEQLMALQSYLRSPSNFTYDTRVPPARSEDAVWDFLQDRRGYCVQFATAMAIMARTLDIPTRVAVGFLPGEARQNGDGFTYVVTGKQAHAWPEVYFAGLGWVRFEPTPAEQTGLPPVWSDPLAGLAPGDQAGPDDFMDPGRTTASPGQVLPPSGPGSGGGPQADDVWRWAGVAAAVLAAAAATIVLLVRRARRPVELTCEHAWHQLRRSLARHAAISWSDATTPRNAVRAVVDGIAAATGRDLEPDALEALRRLASAVEQERYAPRPDTPSSGELHRWLATVRHAVARQVSDRTRRDGGPSALPSGS